MTFLEALPILIRYVPAIINVIAEAFGGQHRDEGAWCAHIPGLADVCRELRDGNGSTRAAVERILADVGAPSDPIRVALARLRDARAVRP